MKQGYRIAAACLLACVTASTASAQGQALINEVYYDTPSTDMGAYTELYTLGNTDFTGWVLEGVNGNGGAVYAEIPLDPLGQVPAGNYVVIGDEFFFDVHGFNPDLQDPLVDFQNGADQVRLVDPSGNIVDSVCYGDSPDLVCEGAPATDVSGTSLIRCPNLTDTDDNSADFAQATAITPRDNNDPGCPVDPIDVTLCEVSEDDADGLPVLNLQLVRLTDLIVMNATGTFSGGRLDLAVYEPATGCCSTLFDVNIDDSLDPFAVGDVISEVVGSVAFFNGLTEVSNITTLVRGGTATPPDPIGISTAELALNGEQYESCLIEICGLEIVGGVWPLEGESLNLDIDDGSGPTVMRIDSDTDIDGSAQPTEPFTITGIGGQFDNSPPHDSGYQVRPRFRAEILDGFDCTVPTVRSSWSEVKGLFK